MGNQVSSCEPHHAWPQRQPSGNHRILQYYTAVWKVLRRIGQRTRHANILAVALPVAPIGSLIGARIIGLGLRASVDARGAECVAAVRLASSPLPPRRTNPASVRSSHPLADMEVSVSELEINNPFTPNPPPFRDCMQLADYARSPAEAIATLLVDSESVPIQRHLLGNGHAESRHNLRSDFTYWSHLAVADSRPFDDAPNRRPMCAAIPQTRMSEASGHVTAT